MIEMLKGSLWWPVCCLQNIWNCHSRGSCFWWWGSSGGMTFKDGRIHSGLLRTLFQPPSSGTARHWFMLPNPWKKEKSLIPLRWPEHCSAFLVCQQCLYRAQNLIFWKPGIEEVLNRLWWSTLLGQMSRLKDNARICYRLMTDIQVGQVSGPGRANFFVWDFWQLRDFCYLVILKCP